MINKLNIIKLAFLDLFLLLLLSSCEYIVDKIWSKEDISYINKSSYEVIFLNADNAQVTLQAGDVYSMKGYGYPSATLVNNVPVIYTSEPRAGVFTNMSSTTITIKNTKNETVVFRCGNSQFSYKETLPASSEKTIKVFSYDGISVLSEKQTFSISFTTNTVNGIIYVYI